jgi:hypothetical protein
MIAFDLICSNGHKFECWFKDGASYEKQKASRLINCPACNDDQVEKALSRFAIKKNGEARKTDADPTRVLQVVKDFIDKHFEDVGPDFTREAIKIHCGESKKKSIRGTATPDQEKLLKEEGVQFLKIPVLKRLDS